MSVKVMNERGSILTVEPLGDGAFRFSIQGGGTYASQVLDADGAEMIVAALTPAPPPSEPAALRLVA